MLHLPSDVVASSEDGEIVAIPDKATWTGFTILLHHRKKTRTCSLWPIARERDREREREGLLLVSTVLSSFIHSSGAASWCVGKEGLSDAVLQKTLWTTPAVPGPQPRQGQRRLLLAQHREGSLLLRRQQLLPEEGAVPGLQRLRRNSRRRQISAHLQYYYCCYLPRVIVISGGFRLHRTCFPL
ncbi:hypothetical protein MLD38_025007 [Melastoma candidum]|uniref:Uncharacterized protein n=1 Tax=Melastoma candidum TaxID=119954 RepID=A0ACB9NZ66_9MYRT|nr:hypothetical protein MLD38_025007 [Melastoma candidum]